MILESLVTTVDESGAVNIAPMGPIVPEGKVDWTTVELRPFKTSTTFANLRKSNTAVLHVTDDVLLLAQAAIGPVSAPTVPAARVSGQRLQDCCRYYELVVESWDVTNDRSQATARVVHAAEVRPFFGLNRGKFAVVELAIAVTRLGILPLEQILAEQERLEPLVTKTGGASEHAAFDLLKRHIASYRAKNP